MVQLGQWRPMPMVRLGLQEDFPATPPASTPTGPRVAIQFTSPASTTFALNMDFHKEGVAVIRQLNQRTWDPDTKTWHIDKSLLDETVEKLRAAPVHAQVSLPPAVRARRAMVLSVAEG